MCIITTVEILLFFHIYNMKNRQIYAGKSSMCFGKETTKKAIKNLNFQFIFNFLVCFYLNYDARLCIQTYHFHGNTTYAIILISEACLFCENGMVTWIMKNTSIIVHDSETACECVEFSQKGYIFMHDLAAGHNSKSTRTLLECKRSLLL